MDKFILEDLIESSSYIKSILDDINIYKEDHKDVSIENQTPEYVHLMYSVFTALRSFIDSVMTNIGTSILVCDTRTNISIETKLNTMIVLFLEVEGNLMYKDSYGEYLFEDIHLNVSPFDIYNGLINFIKYNLGEEI